MRQLEEMPGLLRAHSRSASRQASCAPPFPAQDPADALPERYPTATEASPIRHPRFRAHQPLEPRFHAQHANHFSPRRPEALA